MRGRPPSWRHSELLVVDIETTGLDLRRDEVVAYGAVVVRGGRLLAGAGVSGLVRPGRPVTPQALMVHGLTAAELAAAPAPAQVAPVVAGLLAGRALVAHAAWVERAFLGRLLAAGGLGLDVPVVDTAALARAVGVVRPGPDGGEPSLEALAARLAVPVHTPHQALGDALTTGHVLLALLARLEATGAAEPLSVAALARLTRRYARDAHL